MRLVREIPLRKLPVFSLEGCKRTKGIRWFLLDGLVRPHRTVHMRKFTWSIATVVAMIWQSCLGVEPPLLAPDDQGRRAMHVEEVWLRESADSALTSGYSSIAARLYEKLLERGNFLAEDREEVVLGLVSALISERRFEAAAEKLEEYGDEVEPAFRLRRAILEFQKGGVRAAAGLLRQLKAEDLGPYDQAWYYLIAGLLREEKQDPMGAESFFEKARAASRSDSQRTLFENILFRSRLLFLRPGQLEENLVTDLRAKVASPAGHIDRFQSAKILAVVLHELGRSDEAITLIEDQLKVRSVREGNLEDEFLLILSLVAGPETSEGRDAFRRLLSKDGSRRLQKIAIQILAQIGVQAGQSEEVGRLLDELIERPTAHTLLDEFYYLRAHLAVNAGELNVAEVNAKSVLEAFPGSMHANGAIRLLAYISWIREPPQYRMAAGYLSRLRAQLDQGPERSRFSILVADSYFRNGDYENAADAYRESLLESDNEAVRGELLFQEIMSEIGANRIEFAERRLDEVARSGQFAASDIWRAEWNLINKMKEERRVDEAFSRVRQVLGKADPQQVEHALRLRMMWLEAQLSVEANRPEQTPAMVARILTELAKVPSDAIGPLQREQIISYTLLLHGQSLFATGHEEQGIGIFRELRESYPEAPPTKLTYLIEAGYLRSIDKLAAAQQRLLALGDEFPESEYAAIALWEAADIADDQNNQREAGRILQELIRRYPGNDLVFYARLKQGHLSRMINDFASAQSVYEDLLTQFPDHFDRFRVEISLADCFLAQSSINAARLSDAAAVLERLVDLPSVPVDLQVEAGLKWGFVLSKMGNRSEAEEAYWMLINRFLKEAVGEPDLASRGRYWIARAIFELGNLLEENDCFDEAITVYALILEHGLPGRAIAVAQTESFGIPEG